MGGHDAHPQGATDHRDLGAFLRDIFPALDIQVRKPLCRGLNPENGKIPVSIRDEYFLHLPYALICKLEDGLIFRGTDGAPPLGQNMEISHRDPVSANQERRADRTLLLSSDNDLRHGRPGFSGKLQLLGSRRLRLHDW